MAQGNGKAGARRLKSALAGLSRTAQIKRRAGARVKLRALLPELDIVDVFAELVERPGLANRAKRDRRTERAEILFSIAIDAAHEDASPRQRARIGRLWATLASDRDREELLAVLVDEIDAGAREYQRGGMDRAVGTVEMAMLMLKADPLVGPTFTDGPEAHTPDRVGMRAAIEAELARLAADSPEHGPRAVTPEGAAARLCVDFGVLPPSRGNKISRYRSAGSVVRKAVLRRRERN